MDGSCLLVCGSIGVAFCDFSTRNWKSLPFDTLLHPRWLGNSHVVALTPDNQQLLLIDRNAEIMKIPVEDSSNIKFIDTYNNWQLILQISGEIVILGFNHESISFTIVTRIPFESDSPLIQAAFLKDKLFTLNCDGTFLVNAGPKLEGCESFLVLFTGHFLIQRSNGAPVLWKDDDDIGQMRPMEIPSSQRILAVLPFTNCLTLLHSDCPHFSLHDPIQSRFILPDLVAIEPNETFMLGWKDDPLYQMALEYVLLKCLNNKDSLQFLERLHQSNVRVFSLAIVSLTRKIEFSEASQDLFAHLSTFTPLLIAKTIELDDALNFLPFLAKSYDENVKERGDAILFILDALFTGIRSYRGRIRKIRAYLSAFPGLEELIVSAGKSKIAKLWQSGRLIKAFELLNALGIEGEFAEISTEKLEYFKVEKAITPEMVPPFFEWLETRGHPETVINALKNS